MGGTSHRDDVGFSDVTAIKQLRWPSVLERLSLEL